MRNYGVPPPVELARGTLIPWPNNIIHPYTPPYLPPPAGAGARREAERRRGPGRHRYSLVAVVNWFGIGVIAGLLLHTLPW